MLKKFLGDYAISSTYYDQTLEIKVQPLVHTLFFAQITQITALVSTQYSQKLSIIGRNKNMTFTPSIL